jgi:hypothetical protein
MVSQNPQFTNEQTVQHSFYKYVKARVAKNILVTRKLRWSSPLLFNDPFDVSQELRLDFDRAALQSAFSAKLAEIAEQGAGAEEIKHPKLRDLMRIVAAAPKGKRHFFAQESRKPMCFQRKGNIEAIKKLEEAWAGIAPDFRILCLSARNDITRMWSSYADNCKGIVLEFSALDESSPFSLARPIRYQDEPPSVAKVENWVSCLLKGELENYIDLFRELMYVKTTDWASEEEWRIVSAAKPEEKRPFVDYSFHPKELKALFLGSECSAEDQADLLKMLAYGLEHVTPYKAFPNAKRPKFDFHLLGKDGDFLPGSVL